MAHIISTINMKGGVGKTTLTVNLATCLAKYHKKRVLVVDLDAQINATLSLVHPNEFVTLKRSEHTISCLINKNIKPTHNDILIQDIIQRNICTVIGLDLLPGDLDLYDDNEIFKMLYRQTVCDNESHLDQVWQEFESCLLKEILQPVINDYDFILLDCAPGYNLLTRSAIQASNFYLIPARPESLSWLGIMLLEKRIKRLRAEHQVDTKMMGVVFTSPGSLAGNYTTVKMKIVEDVGLSKIFKTEIPHNVSVAEAVDKRQPVVLAFPHSKGAEAFTDLTKEFLQKLAISLGETQTKKQSDYTSVIN